jgi:hypothetical protein
MGLTAFVTYVLLRSIQYKNRLRTRGLHTLATVTGQETSSETDGGIMYCLRVRFTARNGRCYAGRSGWYSSPPPQEVGDTVVLVYEENNPYSFKLEAELTQTKNYLLLVLTWAGAAYFLWPSY